MKGKTTVRMLDAHLGLFHKDCATGEEIRDVKRGDIVSLPDDIANRYVANALASKKHLKTDLDELPAPYQVTEESRSMRESLADEDRRRLAAVREQSGQPAVATVPASNRPKAWDGWRV